MFNKFRRLLAEIKNIDFYKQQAIEMKKQINKLEGELHGQKVQRDLMFWQLYKKPEETLHQAKMRFFHAMPPAEGNARKSQLVMAALLKRIHDTCEQNNLFYWMDFGTLLGAIRHGGFIPWDDDIDIGMMRADAERLCEIMRQDPEVFVKYLYANTNANGITKICQIRWADTPKGPYLGSIDIFIYDYCEKRSSQLWTYFMKHKLELIEESRKHPIVKGPLKNWLIEGVQERLEKVYRNFETPLIDKLTITREEAPNIILGFNNFYYINYCDEHFFSKEMIFPLKKIKYEENFFYVPNHYMRYISPMYEDIFSLPMDIASHKHINITDKKVAALNYLYNKYVNDKSH